VRTFLITARIRPAYVARRNKVEIEVNAVQPLKGKVLSGLVRIVDAVAAG
jgi:hypothetical protein